MISYHESKTEFNIEENSGFFISENDNLTYLVIFKKHESPINVIFENTDPLAAGLYPDERRCEVDIRICCSIQRLKYRKNMMYIMNKDLFYMH